MRVTVICSDLSTNGLGRAHLLSEILSRDFDVDLIGTRFGDDVWEPVRGRAFHEVVAGGRWPGYARSVVRLMRRIRGDVVYAVKPLPSSYGVALLHRVRTGVPVVLDVDDDELSFRPSISLRHPLRLASDLSWPNGRHATRVAIFLARHADAVTVASTGLQRLYGGTLVPHAKDTAQMHPGVVSRSAARAALGLGDERVVMFVGTPRPFKGIEDVVAALPLMRNLFRFVVAGADAAAPYVRQLMQQSPEVQFVPPFPIGELARVLEAADVIVVPQRLEPQTIHQQPSKLLDAMAMARPIVATGVADIPAILGDGRGLVVSPGDLPGLARALDTMFDDFANAERMGQRAREWCVANASYDAVQPVLRDVITAAARKRR